MKSRYIKLFAIGTASIVSVFLLYRISVSWNNRKNGFIRKFYYHTITTIRTIDIKYKNFYIAGLTRQKIYLNNRDYPENLIVAGYNLDTSHLRINLSGIDGLRWAGIRVFVDSPYYYIIEVSSSSLFYGRLPDFKNISKMQNRTYFNGICPLPPYSFILRTIDEELQQNILVKKMPGQELMTYRYVMEKQGNGIFSVDGMINYDAKSSEIVYLYYYRNQAICLDSNLRVVRTLNTIDTNTIAKISVAPIYSDSMTTMSAPPLTVNKQSCTYGGTLYVHSKLKANNEMKDYFNGNSVIDVYDLNAGIYKFSFYIPNLFRSPMKNFKVYEDKVVAIYDHHLAVFTLI